MTQESPTPVSLYQEPDQGLSLDSAFTFHCHAGLACFNRCCLAPTIILSPYDILRLKDCLGISSGDFLERYTLRHPEEISNLPLVFLDAFSAPGGCPFLEAGGCRVYAHRPAACRLFPITMGSQLTEQGVVDHYFCRKLDYCQGFAADAEWTVASWQANQGFGEYEQERREWFTIILKKGLEGPLDSYPRVQDLFYTIAYDLDGCRGLLSDPAFLQAAGLEGGAAAYLQMDDLELLQFSSRYLQSVLLGEGAGLRLIARRISLSF